MEPIISPWIFYVIDTLGSLSIGIAFSLAACIGIWIAFLICSDDPDETEKTEKPWANKQIFSSHFPTIGVIIILIIIEVFIPSKTTMYKMLEASYCTQTNIEAAGGDIDAVLDKIESRAKAMK